MPGTLNTVPNNGGMHNLSTLLKRLEGEPSVIALIPSKIRSDIAAVTSRLEDVATSNTSAGAQTLRSPTSSAHEQLAGHAGAPGAPPPPPPPPPPAPSAPAASSGEMSAEATAYKELIDGPIKQFLAKSEAIGGLVAEHASLLPALASAQLDFINLASSHAKPGQKEFGPLLGPQAQAIQAILEAKDKLGRTKDGREWGTCLSVVGEGVSAFGWVQVEPAPAPFINEMKNSSQFWVDRVQKQFKETKPDVVAWAKSFIVVIDSLHAYVKQYHTTGVKWSPNGPPAPPSVPSSGGASGGAPPPPPPPPPGGPSASGAPSRSAGGGGGQAALLADLNRGGSVTSGLKKVDKSQMTHKNPELRQSSAVSSDAAKRVPPEIKPKPGASTPTKKPAKTELEDGNKWTVEYHEDNKEILIDQTELSHVVHIFGCTRSVIRISGKINAITMVNCKKTAVVLDSAVSSLSITSSPGFEVQITGSVPTVQVDTTDGGQVYLSKECMEVVEIITSKTSGLNVSVPTGEEGDFEERPVPEQMKSVVRGGKLVTEIVEHAG